MILVALTLIIWMTTALRQISLITSQGQSLLVFLNITLLTLPKLIAIIAPVALLIATLHTMNRISGDSELIVLSASGATVWHVLKPYLVLAALVSAAVFVANAYLTPLSARVLREYAIKVRTDLVSQVLQPGEQQKPERGLSFFFKKRDMKSGDLLGLVVADERDPEQNMTYWAKRSQFRERGGKPFLSMWNGEIHQKRAKEKNVTIVVFEKNIFDLTQFGPKEGHHDYKPRERFLTELPAQMRQVKEGTREQGKLRREFFDRLSNPLYPFLFVLVAGVYLGYPRTTRDNRMQSLFGAFGFAAFLRVLGLAATNAVVQKSEAVFLLFGIPIGGIILATIMVHYQIKPLTFSWPSFLAKRQPSQKNQPRRMQSPVQRGGRSRV
jgi:lipopolysaccharide export system permease protein